MTKTLSEAATKRAAVAMLRTLGATEVVVRTAVAIGSDKRASATSNCSRPNPRWSPALVKQVSDKPMRFEILLPAAEVQTKLNLEEATACDALRQLGGICWGDHLLRVTLVTAELFAGCAYLYKISAEG